MRATSKPGTDYFPFIGDQEPILDEIERFLTGSSHRRESDRFLATVLLTDIVDSTRRAAELGDRRWPELLEQHNRLVRAEIDRAHGRDVASNGDGFLATFDGPTRAVRCAQSVTDAVRSLGLEVRAGLHTGEVEPTTDGIGGLGSTSRRASRRCRVRARFLSRPRSVTSWRAQAFNLMTEGA